MSPDPTANPTYTIQDDGLVRFDLCRDCVTQGDGLDAITVEEIDPLH